MRTVTSARRSSALGIAAVLMIGTIDAGELSGSDAVAAAPATINLGPVSVPEGYGVTVSVTNLGPRPRHFVAKIIDHTGATRAQHRQLIYSGESGALNESMSDVFGVRAEVSVEGSSKGWVTALSLIDSGIYQNHEALESATVCSPLVQLGATQQPRLLIANLSIGWESYVVSVRDRAGMLSSRVLVEVPPGAIAAKALAEAWGDTGARISVKPPNNSPFLASLSIIDMPAEKSATYSIFDECHDFEQNGG